MNILITGGLGFIGTNLVTHLLKNPDNHITLIDDLSTSVRENPVGWDNNRIDIHIMDLGEEKTENFMKLRKILAETDVCYHLAGSVGVKYIDKDPSGTLQNSFNINNVLFPLFEEFKTKVVYASTSEVYGNTKEAKETDTLSIGSPDTMRWGYACAKLMSEFLLKSYTFPSVIVRFFNVTGKTQQSEHGMVLPNFIKNAKNKEPLIIYGDGNQYRTFCDIRDAVEMLELLGTDDIHNGEIYNIGNSNNLYTINELAARVLIQYEGSVEYRKYEQDFSKDFGEIYERRPNTDKINKYYQCKYTLNDIIRSM